MIDVEGSCQFAFSTKVNESQIDNLDQLVIKDIIEIVPEIGQGILKKIENLGLLTVGTLLRADPTNPMSVATDAVEDICNLAKITLKKWTMDNICAKNFTENKQYLTNFISVQMNRCRS